MRQIAQDVVHGAEENSVMLAGQVGRIVQQTRQLAKDLTRLGVVVKALTDELASRGLLDVDALNSRIEAEWGNLVAPKAPMKPSTADTPYREMPTAADGAVEMVACQQCGLRVPIQQTMIGVTGTVCERCFAGTPQP
jgi:hypothetical protein